MKYRLRCLSCKRVYNEEYPKQTCRHCGKNLEVVYGKKGFKPGDGSSFWYYKKYLPNGEYKKYELGGTKLVRNNEIQNLYMKLETENPTRSFKDRGSVVEVSKATEYGYNEIVCASTGNMAFSLSYYAELAGIGARVFISRDANKDKIRDIREVGNAKIERVNGDFNKAMGLAYKYAEKNGAFLTGDYCYRQEGQKTLAYEVMDQLPSITHLIVPVGNATLLSGIFKALVHMTDNGRIRRMPRIIAVQAEGCMPLVNAFKHHKKITYEKPRTIADAIAVGYPTFGEQALNALKKTGGDAIAVSDREMMREKELLHKEYGIIAEPSGVSTIAAFRKMNVKESETIAAIISGGNV